jgi:hypothetical protein
MSNNIGPWRENMVKRIIDFTTKVVYPNGNQKKWREKTL